MVGSKDKIPSNWSRPTPDECREVTRRLIELHGKPKREKDPLETHNGCHGQVQVLDSLIRILLSQNTTDKTSIRAFQTLKERFPTWEEVLAAPNSQVEDAIRVGGLAAIKVERMKALLQHLKEERGTCCLEWLREESIENIKNYLSQFKGFGPKTISCMLLFCLDQPEFPVDTHVHNIAKALHFIPQTATRERAYEHLNKVVPDDVKFDLHVLLVEHGKACGSCSKGKKRGSIHECPLTELKRGGGYLKIKKEEEDGEEEVVEKKRVKVKEEDEDVKIDVVKKEED